MILNVDAFGNFIGHECSPFWVIQTVWREQIVWDLSLARSGLILCSNSSVHFLLQCPANQELSWMFLLHLAHCRTKIYSFVVIYSPLFFKLFHLVESYKHVFSSVIMVGLGSANGCFNNFILEWKFYRSCLRDVFNFFSAGNWCHNWFGYLLLFQAKYFSFCTKIENKGLCQAVL